VVDHVDPAKRSLIMAAVRSKDTRPEMAVRRLVYEMGYRYRLHAYDLPGHPDMVFRGKKKALFVHGCFWHRHSGCRYSTTPKTKTSFWSAKFSANVARDRRNSRALRRAGWRILAVWQCQLKNPKTLAKRIHEFLESEH
jgi:DNA mismatch endonuclease (patch repair protein)